MAQFIEYDDSQLEKMFAELAPKQRIRALRGAFKKAANKVRKTAISNLRKSIRSDSDLEKGVRSIVFKEKAGFRVTVGTKKANRRTGKGGYGYHTNRRGLKKPVLIWAEDGTDGRRTKPGFFSSRKAHSTGLMKRYGFMVKAKQQIMPGVTEDLHNQVKANVIRIAKKYGCKA